MANNFQRLFYIFKKIDRDEGCPAGYIRVEINSGKAKLQISLSNLANRKGLTYQLYGIKKTEKQLEYTVVCDLPNENGRSDIKIDMDVSNIGTNRLSLEDISIFAVVAHLAEKTHAIKFPLAAYTKGEVSWKEEFEDVLLKRENPKMADNTNTTVIDNSNSDAETRQTDTNMGKLHVIRPSGKAEEKQTEQSQKEEEVPENGTETLPENTEESVFRRFESTITEEQENNSSYSIIEAELQEKANDLSDNEADQLYIEEGEEAGTDMDISSETANTDEADSEYIQSRNSFQSCSEDIEQTTDDASEHYCDAQFSISNKFESAITSVYNPDRSAQADQARMPELTSYENDIRDMEYAEPETISAVPESKGKAIFNMQGLKEELNRSFESYNPFKMKSRNFVWWKINSPGYLNNILYRNNIRTYLLFNPKVMLAHYKYRYIIFGVRNDRRSGREYLICGVPGVYSIDQNPFGNMGSWAQTEGFKPKYGAFGYWVIMIDPRTGKLMKVK